MNSKGQIFNLPEERTIVHYGKGIHLDSSLAPRLTKYGQITWMGSASTVEERNKIPFNTTECPQGQFLLHHLSNGFSAIQWWDRCQGDDRLGCNSTVLLEGVHTADELLNAFRQYFPHLLENLDRAGVKLIEVHHEAPAQTR